MVFDARFTAGLLVRVVLLGAALAAVAWSVTRDGLAAVRIVAILLAAFAAWLLWAHVRRTNREVARFVEAIHHGDLSQGFSARGGAGFDRLGAALDTAMRRLRDERAQLADESRFNAALVDEVPTAILVIDGEGRVDLANKAARKLFHRLRGVQLSDFAEEYGQEFVAALDGVPTGKRRLTRIAIDGVAQRAMLIPAEVRRIGERLRIVSVQPIHGELSDVELAAQADLVRVLTHEIMNSMTPVTSLAASAAALMQEVDDGSNPAIGDARLAVETLSRRAGGIMHFVETYRSFSRAPQVRPRRFAVGPWADELGRLFAASDQGAGVAFAARIEPPDLVVDADPDLLAQVAINLLKNGAEAAAGHATEPRVALAATLLPGGRTRFAVSDNGPGVPDCFADDVFLPFFTTKSKGTGVGLSLARRIVVAHGGTIGMAERGADEGACFEIVL